MPTVRELKAMLRDRAHRLARAEEQAPPLPPGDRIPDTFVMLGEWHQDAAGDFFPGPTGAMFAVRPDGRKRAIRELPAGDYGKLIAGVNPYELV